MTTRALLCVGKTLAIDWPAGAGPTELDAPELETRTGGANRGGGAPRGDC